MAARAAPQRIPGEPAEAGDNYSPAEKKEAVYWARKQTVISIRAEKQAAEEIVKAIGKRLTTARNEFKRDTGINLKRLDAIVELAEMERGDRHKDIQDFNWMAQLEGLAPGDQVSLLDAFDAQEKVPTIPRDELDWEMEGRSFYNRNLECKPPPECPPINITNFTKGWHDQQEKTAWAMATVKVIDRDPDHRTVGPPEFEEEEDDGLELTEAAIKAQAKALKNSKFMQTADVDPDAEPAE